MTYFAVLRKDRSAVQERDILAWLDGKDGIEVMTFGHRKQCAFLYKVQNQMGGAQPPQTLDGQSWIIGTVRLDARQELLAALDVPANPILRTSSDAQLCLAAYARWKGEFANHISGDYSFIIWDDRAQSLLAVRDRLGIKLLYHWQHGNQIAIGNSLEWLASMPLARDELDEVWIADFLINGYSTDAARTVYAQISNVPPAHCLSVSDKGTQLRRYWTLQQPELILHKRLEPYSEAFHALLSAAVADRMPQKGPVGVLLSGGLDSPTLASKAVEVANDPSRIVAHTRVFRSIIKDEEEYYSRLVAERLSIRQEIIAVDDLYYDPEWRQQNATPPQPVVGSMVGPGTRFLAKSMSQHAKVWFYGEGPDNALTFEWRPYLKWLWSRGQHLLAAQTAIGILNKTSAREWVTAFGRIASRGSPFINPLVVHGTPSWFEESFARTVALARSSDDTSQLVEAVQFWRPRAMNSFASGSWQFLFANLDTTFTQSPIEWRHPFLDLRVLEFLLAVPPAPWSRHKRLLRDSMRGILPSPVLKRPKTPLSADPVVALIERHPLPEISASSPVGRFVDRSKLVDPVASGVTAHDQLRIHVLDHWMHRRGYS